MTSGHKKMFGETFGAQEVADFMRIAYSQLLRHGYNLYVPLQRPLFDEIVILDRGRLSLCVVREAMLCKDRGPTLNTKFMLEHKDTLLSDLSIDMLVAVLCSKRQVWLIPLSSITDITTVRLQHHSEWLLGEVYNQTLDPVTREQRRSERQLVAEAKDETEFYKRVLR